jgi:hypothetical protein
VDDVADLQYIDDAMIASLEPRPLEAASLNKMLERLRKQSFQELGQCGSMAACTTLSGNAVSLPQGDLRK